MGELLADVVAGNVAQRGGATADECGELFTEGQVVVAFYVREGAGLVDDQARRAEVIRYEPVDLGHTAAAAEINRRIEVREVPHRIRVSINGEADLITSHYSRRQIVGYAGSVAVRDRLLP